MWVDKWTSMMSNDNGSDDNPDAMKPIGAAAIPEEPIAPLTVGAQLRAAREAMGKSLADISAMTKVPVRSLDAIERMAMNELPTGPYATGFVRTFARTVGLNADQAVAAMRAVTQTEAAGAPSSTTYYEPADAARVPPSNLVWLSLGIAVLIAAGYGVWRSEIFAGNGAAVPSAVVEASPTTGEGAAVSPAPSTVPPAPTVTVAPTAPVLISATGPLYFSLDNAEGRPQFDLTLNAGEFYTVKANQRDLFLRTATPQSLKLVVDGTALPAIGTADTLLSGVGLDAMSLSRIASGQWQPPVAATTPAAPPATR